MRLLLCLLALLLTAPLARGQHDYKPLQSACKVGPFYHFDRGQPRARFGQDLSAYFTSRVPARLYRNFKGLVLVEVHVDSLGQPCALRLANHTFGSDPTLLNLPALIGAMPHWMPARLYGKPVNMGVALRFTFGNQTLAVDYDNRDDHSQNRRTSGSPSPLVIANKTQRYLPAPARIKVRAFTTQNSVLPWDYTTAVAAAPDHTLWAGTMNGLVHAKAGGQLSVFTTTNTPICPPIGNSVSVLGLVVDSRNHVWLATHSEVYRFDGRQWTKFDLTNSPLSYCHRLFADAAGNVWFVIRDGLARYDGQQWTVLTRQNSALPSSFIRTVFVDSRHRTWISSEEGTVCFDSPQATTYTDPKFPWGRLSFSNAAEDSAGNLWFALSGPSPGPKGLACYSARGEWTSYSLANSGLPGHAVTDVACEPKTNVVWVSVFQVGLARFDGSRWSLFTPANSAVPSTNIWDLTFDADGRLWGATSIGLVQVQP